MGSCDYLDPALAWTGVRDSGRGVSLSKFGTRMSLTLWIIPLTQFRRVRPAHTSQVGPHEDEDVSHRFCPGKRGSVGVVEDDPGVEKKIRTTLRILGSRA